MEPRAFQDEFAEMGFHQCWRCGGQNEQGLQTKSYWEGEESVCAWQPQSDHQAWLGIVNGGILTTILDCHCTCTAIADATRSLGNFHFGVKRLTFRTRRSLMETMHVPDGEGKKRIPSSSPHQAPILWSWILVIVAWTIALVATLTNQNSLIDHHYLLEESHLPVLVALVVFLAVWQVMTVGMMLPSCMPMVSLIVHAGRQQRRTQAVPAAFLAGYAVIWTAFALVAFVGDTQIHWLVHHWLWLDTHPWLIGATTFAIAGVFQFSPLKRRCLKQCRSPFSFFVRSSRKGVGAAWHLGLRHGAFCLGSCWALMLVMFGIGVGSLVSMAVLTGVIVIEKTSPSGQRLSPVIGIILLGLSALWLAHPAWLLGGIAV